MEHIGQKPVIPVQVKTPPIAIAIHITKAVGAKRKPKQAIHAPTKILHTRSRLGTFFLILIIHLSLFF